MHLYVIFCTKSLFIITANIIIFIIHPNLQFHAYNISQHYSCSQFEGPITLERLMQKTFIKQYQRLHVFIWYLDQVHYSCFPS